MNSLKPEFVTVWDKGHSLGTAEVKSDGSWSYSVSNLVIGEHTFRATIKELQSPPVTVNVKDKAIKLSIPHLKNSTASGPGSESIDYYACPYDGVIEIPDYGMKSGDTIRVTWRGRNATFNTEIQTVKDPVVPMSFTISKYELVDCIRHNATVIYTVKRPPSVEIHTSPVLNVEVSGHDFDILAPSLSPGHDEAIVRRQESFGTKSTARLRAIGVGSWESESEVFGDNQALNFRINPEWIDANKGKSVLFNWSLKLNRGDTQLFFSQILRVGKL